MSDLGTDSVERLGRATSVTDRFSSSGGVIGGPTRTNERTNELTKKALRSDESFSSATRPGGHKESDESDELRTDFIAPTPRTRAEVTRTGRREPISIVTRKLIYRRDNWTCQQCGRRAFALKAEERTGALHLDHIIPWSAGGTDRSDNLRTLCGPCNVDRSNFVRKSDRPAMPCVRACAPCLSDHPIIEKALSVPTETFPVYCGARSHVSWAIPGWRIL